MSETPANSDEAKTPAKRTEGDLIPAGPAGIIALAALITAAIAVSFFLRKGIYGGVDEMHPVSLMGVNLAFCAMIMAALAAYRCRGVPNQKHSRLAALAALLLSMAGITLAMFQVIHWRKSTEFAELKRCEIIATSAKEYARAHDNRYPAGLAVLVAAPEGSPWRIPAEALSSPYRATKPITDLAALKTLLAEKPDLAEALVLKHSDFVYLGADLPGKDKYAMQMDASRIIVATSKQDNGAAFDKRLGEKITVAFANGQSKFIEAPALGEFLKQSNAARADRELPPMDNFGKLIPSLEKRSQ
jgi:hypothetical protein